MRGHLWRFWLLIALTKPDFLTEAGTVKELCRLAKLTPASTFPDEFMHLNLQSEFHEEKLEKFCNSVFSRFDSLVQKA